MNVILETRGLTKRHRSGWRRRVVTALDDLNLAIEPGEVFGLIGHNGAGKTTTFKLLLGLLRPTKGEILFHGRPIDTATREHIGFLPEQPYFYEHLTVEETLHLFARLCGVSADERRRRVAALLNDLRLAPKKNARIHTLSKGTLQRVGLAQAILNRPELLILDEPMSGLDPTGRRAVRDLVAALQRDGTTIIFSSHVLPDAEALCDRVGILVGGRLRDVVSLRQEDQPAEYLMSVRRAASDTMDTLAKIAARPPAIEGESVQVRLADPLAVQRALDAVHRGDALLESLTPVHMSLEERFLAHVSQQDAGD